MPARPSRCPRRPKPRPCSRALRRQRCQRCQRRQRWQRQCRRLPSCASRPRSRQAPAQGRAWPSRCSSRLSAPTRRHCSPMRRGPGSGHCGLASPRRHPTLLRQRRTPRRCRRSRTQGPQAPPKCWSPRLHRRQNKRPRQPHHCASQRRLPALHRPLGLHRSHRPYRLHRLHWLHRLLCFAPALLRRVPCPPAPRRRRRTLAKPYRPKPKPARRQRARPHPSTPPAFRRRRACSTA